MVPPWVEPVARLEAEGAGPDGCFRGAPRRGSELEPVLGCDPSGAPGGRSRPPRERLDSAGRVVPLGPGEVGGVHREVPVGGTRVSLAAGSSPRKLLRTRLLRRGWLRRAGSGVRIAVPVRWARRSSSQHRKSDRAVLATLARRLRAPELQGLAVPHHVEGAPATPESSLGNIRASPRHDFVVLIHPSYRFP